MSIAIRAHFEPLRELVFGGISGTYAGVGTAFSHPIRVIYIQNLTDVSMVFSLDGINDHFMLPMGGYVIFDVSSNKTVHQGFFFAEGTRVYVKQYSEAPTIGNVNVAAMYGETGL